MKEGQRKANVIKADSSLQQKAGVGKIETGKVEKSEEYLDNNEVDFSPIANKSLDRLGEAVADAAQNPDSDMKRRIEAMNAPVMELKANAKTFKYTLVGNLANVMMSFLESIEHLDKDAIQIVEAHHKTLKAIVANKMVGDGGQHGEAMLTELKEACRRYFSKRQKKS